MAMELEGLLKIGVISKPLKLRYTANVNRQTTDKLLFSYAIITGENV